MTGLRLTVVDNNRTLAEYIRDVAEPLGCETEIYDNGTAFLESLSKGEPNLLILDLMMPGIDGMEVLNQLSQKMVRCPIYIMSGADAPILDAARYIGEAGDLVILGTLSKPIRAAQLRFLLERAFKIDQAS